MSVGFCVARTTVKGNTRASMRGTGSCNDPTLFSYMDIS